MRGAKAGGGDSNFRGGQRTLCPPSQILPQEHFLQLLSEALKSRSLMHQDEGQMIIYVPLFSKLHCECAQKAGKGFTQFILFCTGVGCVCWGGGWGMGRSVCFQPV